MEQNLQKIHYESIHDKYEQHYYDRYSMIYREEFFYKKLFSGLDLNNKLVADLACGSGHNFIEIKDSLPQCKTIGFDISKKAREAYRRNVSSDSVCLDLTEKMQSGYEGRFDVAVVIGGLHHCVSDLDTTIHNIYRLLNGNGVLLMIELKACFFAECFRKFWYKKDIYFEETTEHALKHSSLQLKYADVFSLKDVSYGGGIAYFIVLNSLIFSLPLFIKKNISHALIGLEKLQGSISGKRISPYFVARWEKKIDV